MRLTEKGREREQKKKKQPSIHPSLLSLPSLSLSVPVFRVYREQGNKEHHNAPLLGACKDFKQAWNTLAGPPIPGKSITNLQIAYYMWWKVSIGGGREGGEQKNKPSTWNVTLSNPPGDCMICSHDIGIGYIWGVVTLCLDSADHFTAQVTLGVVVIRGYSRYWNDDTGMK